MAQTLGKCGEEFLTNLVDPLRHLESGSAEQLRLHLGGPKIALESPLARLGHQMIDADVEVAFDLGEDRVVVVE